MKNIDNYILRVFRNSARIEHEIKAEYNSARAYFIKINRWFDEEELKDRYFFDPSVKLDVDLLFNKEQRERFRENVCIGINNQISSIKGKAKGSVLGELEFLKSQWFDIWETDNLNFKNEYLQGSYICGYRKNIEYGKMVNMFEYDVIRIKFLEILKRKIEELDNKNVNNADLGSIKKSSKNPSVRALALYHTFLIESGLELPFDKREGGRKEAMKFILNGRDDKNFRVELVKVSTPKSRQKLEYKKDFMQCLEMLNEDKNKYKDVIIKVKAEFKVICPL